MSDAEFADLKSANFKLGDRVKIRTDSAPIGRIAEVRGPFGPGGMMVYRIRLRKRPKPAYVEVREDQLELLAPASTPASPTPADPTAEPAAPLNSLTPG